MLDYFKTLTFEELCLKLCENKPTLIIYHIRSDADAVGSAFALREILSRMGIPCYCACSDEIPERLRFLSDDTQGSALIDKEMAIGFERVISVDSASPAQLGELFTRIRKDVDIMIDHHASGSPYADNYIDANASATGEIIYKIAKQLVKDERLECITPKIQNCVYAAISSDTGGFRFANASPECLRIAAELRESGVDTAEINRLLFDSKPLLQLRAEGEAIKNLHVYEDGRIASSVFTYRAREILGVNDDDLGTLIDIPRSVEGVEIAFVVKEEENGSCRVSMRSATDFDVSKVCAIFGGGGHMRASGCTINSRTAKEAEELILEEISKRL